MQEIKFSICIAVKNAEKSIKTCLSSILIQSFDSYEILVQDACSSDSTLMIVNECADERIKVCSERDEGIADAWNKMIERAAGDWLIFMGADDFFANDSVLSQLAAKVENMHSRVVIGAVNYVDSAYEVVGVNEPVWNKSLFRGAVMNFCHQGVLHNRILFEEYGVFNKKFRIAADYEFLLRYLKNNDPVIINNLVMLVGQDGLSHNDAYSMGVHLEYARARRINKQKTAWIFYFYLFRSSIKYLFSRVFGSCAPRFINWLRPVFGRSRRRIK